MRKYAAQFVSVTCIGSLHQQLTKGAIYGLYVLKGRPAGEREGEAPADTLFCQSKRPPREYIKSIQKAGRNYSVRLTDGSTDFTRNLAAEQPARLALPNDMLGLSMKDFKSRKPSTRAVPQHHIDEAAAEGWGRTAFWIIMGLGVVSVLAGLSS